MALTAVEEAQLRDLIAQQSALLSLAGVEATILSKLGATKVTLSDLPTASVIDDADLLLLRQGVTDKSVTGLTFKNLIPSTITTPPQFDNDTSIANTEFVQRALGGYSAMTSYATTAQTIPAAQANRMINLSGSASTITLPLANSVPSGSVVRFVAQIASTISRQGADTILASSTSIALTSVAIANGGELTFISNGVDIWVVTGADALTYSTGFYNTLLAKFNATGAAPVYACRAWVNFNGTGTVAIKASGNVTSITDGGVGIYTVNFTTAMQDTNYGAVVTCTKQGGPSTESGGPKATQGSAPDLKSTTQVQLIFNDANGNKDLADISVSIFR